MTKTKEQGKTLTQLKEDREKAARDIQTLEQNRIMMQGVIAYLNREIAALEKPTKEAE